MAHPHKVQDHQKKLNFLIMAGGAREPRLQGRFVLLKAAEDSHVNLLFDELTRANPDCQIGLLFGEQIQHADRNFSAQHRIYNKRSSIFSRAALIYKLRKERYDGIFLLNNTVSRMGNLFFETAVFFLRGRQKYLVEPDYLETLRGVSCSFGKQRTGKIDSYREMLKNFRANVPKNESIFIKQPFSLAQVSIVYLAGRLNFLWLLYQNLSRVFYLIIFIAGSFCLFIKNIFFIISGRAKYSADQGFFDEYYKLPSYAFTKTTEAAYFKEIALRSPSLEIGIENGIISELLFKKNGPFDFGMEYYYPTMPRPGSCPVFRALFSGSVYRMPVKDGAFNSVVLVHTVDHLEDINGALSELSRILKAGGRLYFSAYSDTRVSRRREDCFSRKYKVCNLFSGEQWVKKCRENNLEIEDIAYFVKNQTAFWMRPLEELGYVIGHLFSAPKASRRERIYCWIARFLLEPYFIEEARAGKNGNNIFCAARKV